MPVSDTTAATFAARKPREDEIDAHGVRVALAAVIGRAVRREG